MSGWIADFFRLVWGLFYWNGRKSIFRLRRGRNPCPCQSPSDSGRAYETHCDASLLWDHPARFQRVCPLLVATPNGLRCSVNTADVRPFWGRALRYVASGLAVLYLAGTLVGFGALRLIGYPVSYVEILWPPAWSHINEARGRYFLQRGRVAMAENNLKGALFSFALAHELAPRNYEVGFALASLFQISQPELSNQYYAQLLREHPERGNETADAWHRALLARGDYRVIKILATHQFVHADTVHVGYWLHTLLFASQQTHDVSPLQVLLARSDPLSPQWRKVLEAELLAGSGHPDQAIAALSHVWPEVTHPYVPFFQIDSLVDLGRPRVALELLESYGSRLRDDERYRLRLHAYAALGWQSLLTSDVELLLTAPPTAPVIELLGTHLARHPDKAILQRVLNRLRETPLSPTQTNHPAFVALFCAAGIAGDFTAMHDLANTLTKINESSSRTITAFEDFFRGRSAQQRIAALLPSLPLPLELTYVILARYSAVPASDRASPTPGPSRLPAAKP